MTGSGGKMNLKKFYTYIVIFSIALLLMSSTTARADGTTYNSTVFTPNGTMYDLDLNVDISVTNQTTTFLNIIMDGTGNLTLYSERMDLDYIRWGGSVAFEIYRYMYTMGNEPEEEYMNMSMPIPPLIAVKQDTREIYLFNISLDQFEEMSEEQIMEIVQTLSSGDLRTDIYITNPFYIPIDVSVGSVIEYGYWNRTANDGFLLEVPINKETTLSVMNTTYDVWAIEYTGTVLDLITMINETFPIGIELPSENDTEAEAIYTLLNETEFLFGVYYDKASGWLLDIRLEIEGSGTLDIVENETTMSVDYMIDVLVDFALEDPGSVSVGGQGLVGRYLGVSDNIVVMLGVGLLILVFGITGKTVFRKR